MKLTYTNGNHNLSGKRDDYNILCEIILYYTLFTRFTAVIRNTRRMIALRCGFSSRFEGLVRHSPGRYRQPSWRILGTGSRKSCISRNRYPEVSGDHNRSGVVISFVFVGVVVGGGVIGVGGDVADDGAAGNGATMTVGTGLSGTPGGNQCWIACLVSTEIDNAQPKLRNVPMMMYSATLRWLAFLISPNRRIDLAAIRNPIPVG